MIIFLYFHIFIYYSSLSCRIGTVVCHRYWRFQRIMMIYFYIFIFLYFYISIFLYILQKSKLQDWNCSVSQILKVLESYDDLQKFSHCRRVLYNRVPKCGSRTLLHVFSNLSSSQDFNLYSDTKLSYLTSKSMVSHGLLSLLFICD